MARRDPVEAMRQHRLAMQLSLQAARDRLARERWADADARLKQRQCGTAAPASAGDTQPSAPLPEQWWQR